MLRKKFLVQSTLSAAGPALICIFGAFALLAAQSCAIAGEDLLQALKPISDAALAKPAADDWPTRRGNFAGWGYSALDQVNARMSAV